MALSDNERLTVELTRLFEEGAEPDAGLLALVYAELRGIAERSMAHQPREHTLQPTALVNEAWLRLAASKELRFEARAQFFALAAKVMRSVLVDHAREKAAAKRGGAHRRVTLADELTAGGGPDVDLLSLEDVLTKLEAMDPELARLVELRFFAGLDHPTIARLSGKSLRSVDRSWRLARAWLHAELPR
jgi:RNA polymerase sigma factor (TIGR02999 family)